MNDSRLRRFVRHLTLAELGASRAGALCRVVKRVERQQNLGDLLIAPGHQLLTAQRRQLFA